MLCTIHGTLCLIKKMSILQEKMFLEIRNKEIFNQTQQYSFEYLESVFDRNVYPTEKALEDLGIFNEELPSNSTTAENIIEQLN